MATTEAAAALGRLRRVIARGHDDRLNLDLLAEATRLRQA